MQKKAPRENNAMLDPVRGDLSIHLDADFHYPVPHTQGKY